MKTRTRSRLLALLLVLVMVMTLLPTAAFAAETAIWTKVNLEDIQPTDMIAITMTASDGTTYALYNGNGTGSAPTAVTGTVDGNTLTAGSSSTLAWNIAKDGDNGYIIYKAGSTETWLYSTNKNNGVRVGTNENKTWVLDSDTGYLKHVATNRYLGVYTTNPDWRAYTNTTGNTKNQTLAFYKFAGTAEGPDEPEVVLPDDPTDHDPVDETKVEGAISLKDVSAKADGDVVTVVGQVAYQLPTNTIFLQDLVGNEIYGLQIYDYTNYDAYKLGDVVKVTGTLQIYGGVPQISCQKGDVTIEVLDSEQEPFPAQELTVAQVLKGADKYVSEYVVIKNVTLGAYQASGNTRITDESGTMNIFKGAAFPNGVAEGSVADVYCAASKYNTTYQLRVGASGDYVSEDATSDLPADGAQVVLYNASAKGVLAGQDDNTESPSINNAAAEIADGKAVPANGARVFTVEKNGEYYRFKTANDGYLCSNGTGNNAFYSMEATEDADWTVTDCDGGVGGFDLQSRTAKYSGYGQWLEYYGGSYKTYSMNPSKVTDYTIYSFYF